MEYKVGEKVIYPNQGVGVIEEISIKDIAGQSEKFYMLRIMSNNSKVMIPISNAERRNSQTLRARSGEEAFYHPPGGARRIQPRLEKPL